MRTRVRCFVKEASPKCKEPSVSFIHCKNGNIFFDKAMLDLRASIIVMPKSVYNKLNLGDIIQLADRSIAYLSGVL